MLHIFWEAKEGGLSDDMQLSPHSRCVLEQTELPSRENWHRVDRSGSGRGKRPKTLRDTSSGGVIAWICVPKDLPKLPGFCVPWQRMAEHTVRGGSRGHLLRQQRLSWERGGPSEQRERNHSKELGCLNPVSYTASAPTTLCHWALPEHDLFDLCGPGGKGFSVLPYTLASIICNFPWSLFPATRRKFSHQNKPRYIATLCQNSLNMIFFEKINFIPY